MSGPALLVSADHATPGSSCRLTAHARTAELCIKNRGCDTLGSVATRKSAMGQSATYEDLVGLPENLVGEIINGWLVTHPRPAPRHVRACSALGGEIWNPYDRGHNGPGGWWILDEPELLLDRDVLVT